MPFQSGSVTFRTFAVTGAKTQTQAVVEQIKTQLFKSEELAIPEKVEYGWSGARHMLDNEINFDNNVYGNAVLFSLRIDTNKVPTDVKKAWTQSEEIAVAKTNPSGFISKAQKKDVKDSVRKQCEDAMREGKYRKTKIVPILWDLDKNLVYANAGGAVLEYLAEIFERTFQLIISPYNADSLAFKCAQALDVVSVYEELKPTRFVLSPQGSDLYPEYPWIAKGLSPKNFLGNEMLLWLWYRACKFDGVVAFPNGKEATFFFDRSLDLDCAYGQTGKESLRGDGPNQSPEAFAGLRIGKIPRKAHLLINCDKSDYSLTLNPETMTFSGVKLPDVEDAETARVVFEERITMLADLLSLFSSLVNSFMTLRLSNWEQTASEIRTWIGK